MGDAAGEAPDRLHLLRLPQLILEPPLVGRAARDRVEENDGGVEPRRVRRDCETALNHTELARCLGDDYLAVDLHKLRRAQSVREHLADQASGDCRRFPVE